MQRRYILFFFSVFWKYFLVASLFFLVKKPWDLILFFFFSLSPCQNEAYGMIFWRNMIWYIFTITHSQWYFSSQRVTDETFTLARCNFSFQVEIILLLSEPKASSVIRWLKLENWKSFEPIEMLNWNSQGYGNWLLKSKQTLFYFEN